MFRYVEEEIACLGKARKCHRSFGEVARDSSIHYDSDLCMIVENEPC